MSLAPPDREAALQRLTLERTEDWMRALVEAIGSRRPTSRAERTASEWLRGELGRAGVDASLESFPAYSTFAVPYGALLALGLAPALLPRRGQLLRSTLACGAGVLGRLEEGLRLRPASRALARWRSVNLLATIEPEREVRRTLCLMGHIDSSRSGLIFSPALEAHLRRVLVGLSFALGAQSLEPLLARSRPGRALALTARTALAAGLALLIERELRGVDVPGANDNASGAALSTALAAGAASERLDSTRLVLLITGAEEAGLLGVDAFLRRHDTRGWLFLNFDGVAAPATLRFLPEEGLLRRWKADRGLVAVAERLAERRPDLGLEAMRVPAGLIYDSTAVLARGGRALTISAQDGTIPNYHQPSDDIRHVDGDTLARAVQVGRELLGAIDRGEADR